jgi:hypothetical protein
MKEPFEQGPIRPPSEAESLLVRLTRNCPWNRCAFCNSYKDGRFSFRTLDEIHHDIDAMCAVAERLREFSMREGQKGVISEKIIRRVFDGYPSFDYYDRVLALWLYRGGKTVFLQDADSLVMKTEDLITVMNYLRRVFPSVERITTYCRSHTAARKTIQELKELRDAGLERVHVGLESGSDDVLKTIKKGTTAEEHIRAGTRIVAAGLSLSEYIIPGLGGIALSEEHAQQTARVINAIKPDFVRLRTLHVVDGTPLKEMMQKGEFTPPGDEGTVKEIRKFIDRLEGIGSTIVSDHILNLLEEVGGTLPGDKEKMLTVIDRYFSLSERQRLIFRLGRRKGLYRSLDDLENENLFGQLNEVVEHYESLGGNMLERQLSAFMNNFI